MKPSTAKTATSVPSGRPLDSVAPIVSVIVPTRNSEHSIAACVASIAAQSYPLIEIIVVDRESTDRTTGIALTMGATVLRAGPERSAQRNVGAASALGDWVLFVDSDMILSPDVVSECIEQSAETSALIVPELGLGRGRLGKLRSLEKELYLGNENVEAARFFPRREFLEIGGYDETLTAGEDWDLTDRWRATGRTIGRTEAFIFHDDGNLSLGALLLKKFYYGRHYVHALRKSRTAVGHLRPSRLLFNRRLARARPLSFASLVALKLLEGLAFGTGLVTGYLSAGFRAGPPKSRVVLWLSTPRGAAVGLAALGALAAQTWFRAGTLIASGDNVPTGLLRPGSALDASRFVWANSTTPTGSLDYNPALQAFPSAFAEFLSWFGLSPHVTQRVFITVLFMSLGPAMFFLLRTLFDKTDKISGLAVGALFYMLSPVMFIVVPNTVLLASVVALPVLSALVLRGVNASGWRYPILFAVATLSLGYAFQNPPAVAMALMGPVVAGLYSLVRNPRRSLTFLSRALPFVVLLNAFWLAPTALALLGSVGRRITGQTDPFSWAWTHERASIANVLRLSPHWGWLRPEYFPFARQLEYGAFVLPAYAPAALTLLSPVATRRHARFAVWLCSGVLLLVFLAKGLHEPLTGVNAFLYRHIPGMWLFREPATKFVIPLSAVFAIGVAMTLLSIARRWVTFIVLVAIIAVAHPIWMGTVIPGDRPLLPPARVSIPDYWRTAASFINNNPGSVLVLPPNDYYQMPYRWGFYGSDFIADELIDPPVIKLFSSGDAYINPDPNAGDVVNEMARLVKEEQWDQSARLFSDAGIRWVIVRRDIHASFPGREIIDPSHISNSIAQSHAFRLTRSFESLDVFQPSTTPRSIVWLAPSARVPTGEDLEAEISLTSRSQTEYRVNIQSESSFIMVLNQTFDEGWTIEGATGPKHVKFDGWANGWVFREGGSFNLVIHYRPQRFVDAARLVSLWTAIALAALVGFLAIRQRRPRSARPFST